ncbi:MAG: DUF1501 domain-containing protein [Pirellulales bacterium]
MEHATSQSPGFPTQQLLPRSVMPRIGRRTFLQIGGLAGAGLTAIDRCLQQAAAASVPLPLRDKSVILLFMHGGPSQYETFDPKMTASANIRSATGELATSLPGITFGGTMSRLAQRAHKLAVVRSFVTGDGNHDIKPVVGRATQGANMGSLYARIAGSTRPDSAMPTNVALFPRAVVPEAGPAITDFGNFEATGELGKQYAPFVPGAGGGLQQDMSLSMDPARLTDRRSLLAAVDSWRRQADRDATFGGWNAFQQQAFDSLLRGVSAAFDLKREDPRSIERYDTGPLVPVERIDKRWNNHRHYADHVASLGKLLLLARRLCEHGCGFVTVTTSFVWDMHADINNAPMVDGMGYVGAPFDHAVSAFIDDCEARGLSDKILLVCCGEMGRTPQLNVHGGRDHWGNLAPLLLYGGGLRMGQVIGQSARDGGQPSSDPVTLADLASTIMHTLVDVGQTRLTRGIPASVLDAISAGRPISGL